MNKFDTYDEHMINLRMYESSKYLKQVFITCVQYFLYACRKMKKDKYKIKNTITAMTNIYNNANNIYMIQKLLKTLFNLTITA